jgi:hypothetical protein
MFVRFNEMLENMKMKHLVNSILPCDSKAIAFQLVLMLTAGFAPPAIAAAINPADFVSTIDNPYYPLIPGTTYFYRGTQEGSILTGEYHVTQDKKVILGVTTTVIRDRAFVDGVLEEETLDWFAQDKDGNVWYFGEDAKELDADGKVVSTEGSWEAGVDGALPGIVMEAHPIVGDTYRQEFALGVAEDMATVLALGQDATVAYGAFTNCIKTKDFSALETSVVEEKLFAPGIGFILSVMVKGGTERLELVDIHNPSPPPPLTARGWTTNASFVVSFPAQAGEIYTVQYRRALTGGDWSVLSNINTIAISQTVEVTDPAAAGQKESYYRLVKP